MVLSSFIALFIPGLLIGASSSFLFLRLLHAPVSLHGDDSEKMEVGANSLVQQVTVRPPSVPERSESVGILERRSERRQVLDRYNKEGCNESSLVSRPITGGPYQLLVLVHSSPRAVEMRNAIRDTWLSANHRQGKFVARFVIGMVNLKPGDVALLACESSEYGDLLLLPGIDDSLKQGSSEKLLQSFIWSRENVQFRYIFKCTDTTFALVHIIMRELEARKKPATPDYLWGFFAGGVQASKKGRLGEESWFLCTHYLPYPEGGGYIISEGLVSILSTISSDLEHYVHDDIALGVWLSPFNGIERRHDVRFNTGGYSRGCNNGYIVTHKETMQTMLKKHEYIEKVGRLCDKEFAARPSYHYNWTVPANKCCVRQNGVP